MYRVIHSRSVAGVLRHSKAKRKARCARCRARCAAPRRPQSTLPRRFACALTQLPACAHINPLGHTTGVGPTARLLPTPRARSRAHDAGGAPAARSEHSLGREAHTNNPRGIRCPAAPAAA